MSSNEWYVERQSEVQGPFSSAELKGMAASGRLLPDDRVRRAQDGKTVAASRIKGLFVATDSAQQPVAESGTPASPPQRQNGAAVTEPPPLPAPSKPSSTEDPADRSFFNHAASVASQLTAASVRAGKIAALEAERVKLRSFSLPKAYAALGRFALDNTPQVGDDFPELVKRIREREELIAKLSKPNSHDGAQQDLAGRARRMTAKVTDAASQKVHESQQNHDLAELGSQVFERYGDDAGSVELATPIREVRHRLDEIEQEVQSLDHQTVGRVLTPRRLAAIGVLACVIIFLGVVSRSLGTGQRGVTANSSTAFAGLSSAEPGLARWSGGTREEFLVHLKAFADPQKGDIAFNIDPKRLDVTGGIRGSSLARFRSIFGSPDQDRPHPDVQTARGQQLRRLWTFRCSDGPLVFDFQRSTPDDDGAFVLTLQRHLYR